MYKGKIVKPSKDENWPENVLPTFEKFNENDTRIVYESTFEVTLGDVFKAADAIKQFAKNLIESE